jgi:hypothetical protein
MNKILSVTLLGIFLSIAPFKKTNPTKLSNFNLDYQIPDGEFNANSMYFVYQGEIYDKQNVQGRVTPTADTVLINLGDAELDVPELKEFFLTTQSLTLEKLNINSHDKEVRISGSRIKQVKTNSDTTEAQNIRVSCSGTSKYLYFSWEAYFNTCIEKGTSRSSISKLFVSSLEEVDFVKDIQLFIENGNLLMTGKGVKGFFTLNLSAKGFMHYNELAKQIEARLDEVKVGPLDLTNKIFSELEQRDDPNLIIDRPWIYYVVQD